MAPAAAQIGDRKGVVAHSPCGGSSAGVETLPLMAIGPRKAHCYRFGSDTRSWLKLDLLSRTSLPHWPRRDSRENLR